YKYGNAQGQDLWEYLGQASGLNIGDIMDSWLEQPGYPVVRAGIEDGNLVLSQKQFFIGTGKDQGRLWQIPLNSNYLQVPKIMKDEKMIIGNYEELRAKNGVAFRLNVGNNSHFIVKYDQQLLDDILSEMDHLNNIDKLQLLQDLGLLAESQEISYADVLPLLVKEAESTSNIVNSKLYGTLAKIKIFATPDSAEEAAIKQFSKQLSESNAERLGVEPHAEESID
ncbi:MAG: ERAP1-like C-terminal domain-containing protein, partial [Lactobacillus iners]|nr:ERAP1-like C-terminal domain-containing protein [Lactobacillus iners]